jgi:hypothetical protein
MTDRLSVDVRVACGAGARCCGLVADGGEDPDNPCLGKGARKR